MFTFSVVLHETKQKKTQTNSQEGAVQTGNHL